MINRKNSNASLCSLERVVRLWVARLDEVNRKPWLYLDADAASKDWGKEASSKTLVLRACPLRGSCRGRSKLRFWCSHERLLL